MLLLPSASSLRRTWHALCGVAARPQVSEATNLPSPNPLPGAASRNSQRLQTETAQLRRLLPR